MAFEKLFRMKPDVSGLTPWGSVATMYVEPHYRVNQKLSAREVPCLIMGYAMETNGYRLLHLEKGMIVEARQENLKFCEDPTVSGMYVKLL